LAADPWALDVDESDEADGELGPLHADSTKARVATAAQA
jgi:hypothetical protein